MQLIKLEKSLNEFIGSGKTLINNNIKDILKLSASLEIRRISFKRTTRKVSGQKGWIFTFLRPSMSAGNEKCTLTIT